MNLLATSVGRRVLFGALYFSEGAPIGYVWWALPTKLHAAGVPVAQSTGLSALLVLPWTLKFLWAPAVDAWRGPHWGRRAWIVSSQVGMGLALLPLMALDLATQLPLVTAFLLAHAVLAATQDVSIDALCIATVPESERGAVNGWMQFGMLLARAIFGGVVLVTERWLGQAGTFAALLACIWGSTALVLLCRVPPEDVAAPARAFLKTLTQTLARRQTWLGLLFAATGGAAFEAVGGTLGQVLLDHGISAGQSGTFRATAVVAAMAGGALLGGTIADRMPRRAVVAGAGTLLATSVLVLALLLWQPHVAPPALYAVLTIFYLCVGVFTACTYALFMDLTDPRLGATEFSAFMGATNLCEAWAVLAAGRLIAPYGYGPAYAVLAVGALLALLIVPWLKTQAEAVDPVGDVSR